MTERSERMSEEAEDHQVLHFQRDTPQPKTINPMKHFHNFDTDANIKPVYTPLALRDWFRAAPRNPLKTTDAPAACPTPTRPGNISRPSRRSQEA